VRWQASLASTNQSLMAQVRQRPAVDDLGWPRLLGAHHQTAGRGRAGRPWKDQAGQALMFSCGFRTTLSLPQIAGLAPAIGIASAEVVRAHLLAEGGSADVHDAVQVKWPNDLMLNDAKLAGILIESSVRQQPQDVTGSNLYLVVGMGLNLSGHQVLSAHLDRPVADLSQTGVPLGLVALTAALANCWQVTLQTLALEGFAPFAIRLRAIDYLQGKMVSVTQQERVLQAGIVQGVNEQGALCLRLSDGSIESVLVGDVSVRWQTPQAASQVSGDRA
jgi:BirA family transcriptional regulator, biotin operon repressor / biotin---[acetyl-CoA-carboxylase] ligase